MSHVPVRRDIYVSSQSRSSSFLVALGTGPVVVKKSQLVGLPCLLFPSTGVQAAVRDSHLRYFEVRDTYTH